MNDFARRRGPRPVTCRRQCRQSRRADFSRYGARHPCEIPRAGQCRVLAARVRESTAFSSSRRGASTVAFQPEWCRTASATDRAWHVDRACLAVAGPGRPIPRARKRSAAVAACAVASSYRFEESGLPWPCRDVVRQDSRASSASRVCPAGALGRDPGAASSSTRCRLGPSRRSASPVPRATRNQCECRAPRGAVVVARPGDQAHVIVAAGYRRWRLLAHMRCGVFF